MNAITVRARLPMPEVAKAEHLSAQQWRVLTDAIFPSAKSAESIMLAVDYCRARNLDVFKRPVHIVPMWNSTLRREVETVWPGINELQVTAARTKQWAGMDEPIWGPEKEQTFTNAKRETYTVRFPEWCVVPMYRLVGGQKCRFVEPVYWLEAYARMGQSDVPTAMWRKRPRGQLHKVAKAASLRAAFPEDTGNDYAAEEMEGKEIEDGGIVIEGVAENMGGASQQQSSAGLVIDEDGNDDSRGAEDNGGNYGDEPDDRPESPRWPITYAEGPKLYGSRDEWIAAWRTRIAGYQKVGALDKLKNFVERRNDATIQYVETHAPDAAAELRALLNEVLAPPSGQPRETAEALNDEIPSLGDGPEPPPPTAQPLAIKPEPRKTAAPSEADHSDDDVGDGLVDQMIAEMTAHKTADEFKAWRAAPSLAHVYNGLTDAQKKRVDDFARGTKLRLGIKS